ncbi:MAG TPA: TatD family hydrolase [Candidatus Saccharimonadales bacterium]|nr:TatD family hydrolase [Candidatus Saccharimonadales bacterium]
MLIDTHCHIHEADYPLDADEVIKRASEVGVEKMICVGTSEESSKRAVEFASTRQGIFAAIGVHPHDTKDGWEEITAHIQKKPVAIGEIGLDYFYTHSPRDVQIKALEGQIDLALTHNLPIIFHVRDAFSDFWPILDNFKGIRGELHSFTDTKQHLEEALKRNLYIGVNGISTFTKNEAQKSMFSSIPLNKLLLETDAPFLTPIPFRGKVNEPGFVKGVAEHQALVRGLSLEQIAATTSANAAALFAL